MGDLSLTEDLSSRLLRLPIYSSMDEEEIGYVVDHAFDGFGGLR